MLGVATTKSLANHQDSNIPAVLRVIPAAHLRPKRYLTKERKCSPQKEFCLFLRGHNPRNFPSKERRVVQLQHGGAMKSTNKQHCNHGNRRKRSRANWCWPSFQTQPTDTVLQVLVNGKITHEAVGRNLQRSLRFQGIIDRDQYPFILVNDAYKKADLVRNGDRIAIRGRFELFGPRANARKIFLGLDIEQPHMSN